MAKYKSKWVLEGRDGGKLVVIDEVDILRSNINVSSSLFSYMQKISYCEDKLLQRFL